MGGQDRFELGREVPAPDDLQVADVMFLAAGTGHIRIIMHVDRSQEGITEFVTAESTEDGRYTLDALPNGPRIHYWRYRDGELEQRYENSQVWEPAYEDPVYRRHFEPAAAAATQ
jgi:hypothetical protein